MLPPSALNSKGPVLSFLTSALISSTCNLVAVISPLTVKLPSIVNGLTIVLTRNTVIVTPSLPTSNVDAVAVSLIPVLAKLVITPPLILLPDNCLSSISAFGAGCLDIASTAALTAAKPFLISISLFSISLIVINPCCYSIYHNEL